jgi:hypothetical protein
MVQLAGGAVFGLVAAVFAYRGDLILGFFFATCAIAWMATASEFLPLRRARKPE